MKLILVTLISGGFTFGPAFAETIVKSCSTTITSPESDQTAPSVIEITEQANVYSARVTQTVAGKTAAHAESSAISTHAVRPGLSKDTDPTRLNLAESLITHAMTLESDPEFKGKLQSGLPLNEIASAKVYLIGTMGPMGGSAIVEAKDRDGRDLGSFLGGFLIAPCAR